MESVLLHRKESVIITVIEIIDELGIQGLTTREIAKRQGISEGTLFRHFKSKSEILYMVLEHYSQYDSDIVQSIELKKLRGINAIRYYFAVYAGYYQNYPAITSIINIHDELKNELKLEVKSKEIFDGRSGYIRRMSQEARIDGEISDKIDAECFADIIFGTFRHLLKNWRDSKYGYSFKEKSEKYIGAIIDAFSTKEFKQS